MSDYAEIETIQKERTNTALTISAATETLHVLPFPEIFETETSSK